MITTEKITEILGSINEDLPTDEFDPNTKLSDLGVESLDTFDLFLRIEEDYGVGVSDEEIEDLDTIQKIVDKINREL
ncbi:MAG TPA: acyl carrier protein [Membranihabitans sp.]|nr:acyl carrier protein [Membranihabitans sp.]